MIYGIGIDLTYIPEFRSAWNEPGTTFFDKYFTGREIEYCQSKGESQLPNHFAARYAAKEAFIKALDSPKLYSPELIKIDFREIEVLNDTGGRPFLKIYSKLKDYTVSEKISKMFLSISHVEEYAIAQVILET